METFIPTHRITIENRDGSTETIDVFADDENNSPAYTREEWDAVDNADWEFVNGTLLFQGSVPTWCESYWFEKLSDEKGGNSK